jgi:isocitrate/isopropylmalate dehydrogenase
MMLKYSFGLNAEHDAVVSAVQATLDAGIMTRDIGADVHVSTLAFGDAVADAL